MSENPYIVVSSPCLYPETIQIDRKSKEMKFIVLDTYKNLEWLLKHFKAVIRYNRMNRKREVFIPDHYTFPDDMDNDVLSRIEYIATLNFFPIKQIDKHLDVIAGENIFHPIVDMIEKNPWDSISRLDDFLGTLKTSNPILDKFVIKTWMLAAMAAAFSVKGFTNHGVLVLQGEQGIGKTEWVKTLDPINCCAVKTGALLDPKNKDSVIGLARFWIVELGELDGTFNKTDIAQLKSYITSDSDDVRVPWGRKETHLVRRTAYIATVNNRNFLVDDTGNRRWWTISVDSINYKHDFDMKQVWAEIKVQLNSGSLTYLPNEIQSLVNDRNQSHERIDPLSELLLTNYNWESVIRREMTATDILIELDFKKPSIGECMRISKILTMINGKGARRVENARFHSIPEKLSFGFSK